MPQASNEEQLLMQEVYRRLAEAEDEVQSGKLLDARQAINEFRKKKEALNENQ